MVKEIDEDGKFKNVNRLDRLAGAYGLHDGKDAGGLHGGYADGFNSSQWTRELPGPSGSSVDWLPTADEIGPGGMIRTTLLPPPQIRNLAAVQIGAHLRHGKHRTIGRTEFMKSQAELISMVVNFKTARTSMRRRFVHSGQTMVKSLHGTM